ncbi:MAG: DUF2953 domain-containing protein [Tyzzerella sp.]|nr:DUF2953 domain-containing protein [Tyzzerella sp.]
MLHILLTILKIIGIILLAILGILILLLLVVNFVPARYQITAESKGDLKTTSVHAKFSWLLHLISGQVTYENEKLDWKVRVAWKKLPGVETKASQSAEDESASGGAETEQNVAEKSEPAESESVNGEPTESKVVESESTEESQETTKQSEAEQQAEPKKTSIFEKIKYTIQKICDKIKAILNMKDKVVAFIKDEIHIAAFGRLKKEIFRLAKFLKPKKINGAVRFGMADPSQTGQILAVLSVLYPFYGENVEIYPEFDKKILEGNLYIKGHVRGVYAVIVAWNLIFDKNVRTMIQSIKTFK